MPKPMRHTLASLFTTLLLGACAYPSHADDIYINTSISGELMPGVYGQVNIGSVPDYVTIYEEPLLIAQPVYGMSMQPIYLYVPPYHAYHWRDHCGYYNACARPVYFVCARDYRPHYFEPRYYNTRVYDPPRAYHHHRPHNHNRHYETMHQREMNRDSRYHRLNEDKGPHYRPNNYRPNNNGQTNSYYRQNNDRQPQYRQNDGRRDDNRRDNDRRQDNDRRHYDRDRDQQRQQLINNQNQRNNTFNNGNQFVRQPQVQPPRNDVIRTRSDDSRNQMRNDTRQVDYRRTQSNDYRPRERAQVPVQQSRQPAFRPQAQQQEQQRGGGRHYGGGQDGRRHEERR